ncbi:carboxypeptidase regulatory-like domain-containing protein [bacterium]|nr:carboxypeptidase regulatory-like domain-containing protein [bacterium]
MKKLSVFLLIFSIILSNVTPAYSWSGKTRTATIQGRITNSATKQAISGVAVRAGRYRANTNASGKYVIKNVKVWFWGRVYRVKVSAKGYYTRSRWIYVRRGSSTIQL